MLLKNFNSGWRYEYVLEKESLAINYLANNDNRITVIKKHVRIVQASVAFIASKKVLLKSNNN